MPTIFEDDFNSYSNGELVGQGGWLEEQRKEKVIVQGTTVKEGAKAVEITSGAPGNVSVYKDGALTATGKITIYFRSPNVGVTDFILNLREGGSNKIYIAAWADGNLKYYDGSAWQIIDPYSANIWYSIEIEWRISDHKARYRLEGGSWTGWDFTNLSWSSGVDRVWIQASAGNPCFFDYIAQDPYVPPAGFSKGSIF